MGRFTIWRLCDDSEVMVGKGYQTLEAAEAAQARFYENRDGCDYEIR